MKHYDLWSLSQKDLAARGNGGLLRERSKIANDRRPLKPQSDRLDDLQTSLLLYNYGLPLDIALVGVCKLSNGQELTCKTKSISSEHVDLFYADTTSARCDKKNIGSTVHIDLDEIGDIKGVCASQNRDGFQLTVDSISKKSLGNKLADMAAHQGIKHDITIAVGPKITRRDPKIGTAASLTTMVICGTVSSLICRRSMHWSELQ